MFFFNLEDQKIECELLGAVAFIDFTKTGNVLYAGVDDDMYLMNLHEVKWKAKHESGLRDEHNYPPMIHEQTYKTAYCYIDECSIIEAFPHDGKVTFILHGDKALTYDLSKAKSLKE